MTLSCIRPLLPGHRPPVSGSNFPLPELHQFLLPRSLLFLTPLLGHAGNVAGHVEFQDHQLMYHPVDGRGGGHGVGEDALPHREDEVLRNAQGSLVVALGYEIEEDFRFIGPLGPIAGGIQKEEVESVSTGTSLCASS